MPSPKPQRILFINRVYPPQRGATGRVLRDLAQDLARDGWQVTVLTTGDANARERDGAVDVIRRRAAPKPRSVPAYFWVALRLSFALLRQKRPTLVVTMTDPPLLAVPAGWAAMLKRARHIHWSQDVYPDLLPVLGVQPPAIAMRLARRLMTGALRRCDHVVAIGGCMARRLAKHGVSPQRLSVIPNWPDAELLFALEDRRRRPRDYQILEAGDGFRPVDELHRDDDPKFRVLYSGTLGFAHPLETILVAAGQLGTSHPEIQFVFAGDGPAFDRLGQERTARGIENIRLLPFQPASRLRDLMESGDIHLVSMDMRAACLLVPSKIYAAFAAGRPVVFVGPPESEGAQMIEKFGAGIVVPQGEAATLAAAIGTLRDDPDRWFAAHEGALRAGMQSRPDHSFAVWRDVVRNVAARKVKVQRGE